jgi:hypothetical protein
VSERERVLCVVCVFFCTELYYERRPTETTFSMHTIEWNTKTTHSQESCVLLVKCSVYEWVVVLYIDDDDDDSGGGWVEDIALYCG